MRKYIIFILILVSFSCEKDPDGYKLWAPDLSSFIGDKKVTLKWFNTIVLDEILRPFTYVDPDNFDIYKSEGSINNFRKITELENDTKYEFTFSNLNNNSTYYFYVIGKKDGFKSVSSKIIMVVPNQKLDFETLVEFPKNQSITSVSYSPVLNKIAYVNKSYTWNGGENCCMAVTVILSSINNQNAELIQINSSEPDWSPNGDKIAFRSENKMPSQIVLYDIATKAITKLTNDTNLSFNPVFSPDGKKILYQSGNTIWVLDLTNLIKIQITDLSANNLISASRPDWINGNEFIFQGTMSNNHTNIYKSSIITKKIELLFESVWNDYRGSISPDAGKIAFISDRSGNLQLWLYTLQTKNFKQLTGYNEDDDFEAYWNKINWLDNNQILSTFGDNRLIKISLL